MELVDAMTVGALTEREAEREGERVTERESEREKGPAKCIKALEKRAL